MHEIVHRAKSDSRQIARPDTQVLRLGFVALTDAAPLIAARDLGLFLKHGLNVELSRELGWASIRDRLIYGDLDAAHALAPLAFSLRLGLHGVAAASVSTAMVLNLQGNGITISRKLFEKGVTDADTLRRLHRSQGRVRFTFGIVSRFSSHHFLLRRWLESGGLDPDRDVRLVVVPPPQMDRALAAGALDGYCVGEPWNSVAALTGHGWCAATSRTLAPGHPEKVLLVRDELGDRPEHDALVRALEEACAWCDQTENRKQLVSMLAGALNMPPNTIAPGLVGPMPEAPDPKSSSDPLAIFHHDHTTEPSHEKGRWILDEMQHAGLLHDLSFDSDSLLEQTFRIDRYQRAHSANTRPPRRRTRTQALAAP